MSKTKTPFFGLGAHGSVGGSITAQKLPKETLLRTKPLPTYRYTLPQAYQRWLYEDYAYHWRQQTDAVKAQHRTAGVPYHLTGFQYWMKYNLTHLPDLLLWSKLDINTGGIAYDSSRNDENGVIIGASPAVGPISNCLSFDGLNDQVKYSFVTGLHGLSALTLELFMRWDGAPGGWNAYAVLAKKEQNTHFYGGSVASKVNFAVFNGGWNITPPSLTSIDDGLIHHLAGAYDGQFVRLYVDGYEETNLNAGAFTIAPSAWLLRLATHRGVSSWFHGIIDNFILYNRALTPAEVLRHSLRRYPV